MSNNKCLICTFNLNNPLLELECSHTFHKNCIDSWLQNQSFCPACNPQIFTQLEQIRGTERRNKEIQKQRIIFEQKCIRKFQGLIITIILLVFLLKWLGIFL